MSADDQPVSHVQWIAADRLTANHWNPNRQAPPEKRLLRLSILENGWTQPVVAHLSGEDADGPLYELVDGFHRWSLACTDREVAALTEGLIPVVLLIEPDPALARMATIRHNRARGTHHVVKMADIVAELVGLGTDPGEIGRRLQMEEEEVERLLDRGQMTKRGASADGSFGQAWVPDASSL